MSAAIDLFIERDYSEVTIQDITARAGLPIRWYIIILRTRKNYSTVRSGV